MGIMDEVIKGVAGKFMGGGKQSPLVDVVLGLINNPQTGGLNGLVETFSKKGLGKAIASWISTGQNQPVSGQEIHQALGEEQIQEISSRLGSSQEEVSGGLAGLLPEIIDKLTPNGTVPDSDSLNQELDVIRKLFSGR